MEPITKLELIEKLKAIRSMGWVQGGRPGNAGSVGNTLEDLLGIPENNLPIPNAAEWELKARRKNSQSLLTLFHMEPSPRTLRLVPQQLLPYYGWPHKNRAKYGGNEMSFRQTISATRISDRGFFVGVNYAEKKVFVNFDTTKVSSAKHHIWLDDIRSRNTDNAWIEPYWGFTDLFHKAGTKLGNCFLLSAKTKIEQGVEFFHYEEVLMLANFSLDKFINAIAEGHVYVDFDARTGHNHGTKFRIHNNIIHTLYDNMTQI